MEASHAIQALGGTNLDERRQAAEACAKNPNMALAAVVPLCRCCSDLDEQVCEWSQAALEELGPPDVDELDSLLDLIPSQEMTAYWAITLIGRLESKAAPAAKQLAAVVEEANAPVEVRNRALWALGKIGTTDADITATLEKAAQSENPRTARLAKKALAKVS